MYLPAWLAKRLRSRRERAAGQSWRTINNQVGVAFDTAATWYPTAKVRSGGNLRDRSNTTKQLRRVYDAAGFAWMTSRTMRRTAASLLDDAGPAVAGGVRPARPYGPANHVPIPRPPAGDHSGR